MWMIAINMARYCAFVSYPPEIIKKFEADHPFSFFILNGDRIVFVGKKVRMIE